MNQSVRWPAVGRSSMAEQGGDKGKDGLVLGSIETQPSAVRAEGSLDWYTGLTEMEEGGTLKT